MNLNWVGPKRCKDSYGLKGALANHSNKTNLNLKYVVVRPFGDLQLILVVYLSQRWNAYDVWLNSGLWFYMYSEVSNKRTAGNKSTAAEIHSQNWTNFLK